VQSVLWAVLADLSQLWAPVLCFFAEEVWQELVTMTARGGQDSSFAGSSVHGRRFGLLRAVAPLELLSDAASERWQSMCRLRRLVVDAIEKEREMQRKLRKPNPACNEQSGRQDRMLMQRSRHAQVDVTLPLPLASEAGDEQPRRGSGEADCRAIHDLLNDLVQATTNAEGEEARGVGFVDEGLEGQDPSSFSLCDYFGVSQVAIRFVPPESESEVDTPVKAGGTRKPAKPKKKGSAPLKELASVSVCSPAKATCSRCDRRAVQLQHSLPSNEALVPNRRPLLCVLCSTL
jgi:hypothetical protein